MYRRVTRKRALSWVDLLVVACIVALIYGLVGLAQRWVGVYHQAVEIDLSPAALPKYVFFSFSRASASYLLSLIFTVFWGYGAAKIPGADRIMVPILDIFQSIPVLGFMPGLVLGLVTLFPNSNIGIELTCIIMIFTGQAWNMGFSFYGSLKTVPSDLQDAASVIGLGWYQRFRRIELPFAAIGLAWNSLMSIAGGWFFLTVCESFTLGDKKFMVPGIGSYMAMAIAKDDGRAMVYGLLAMFLLIVFVDFIIWRPIMAWVRKFQMEEIQEEVVEAPAAALMLRESFILGGFSPWLGRRMRMFFRKKKGKRRAPRLPAVFSRTEAVLMPLVRLPLLRVKAGVQVGRHWIAWGLVKFFVPLTIIFCAWGGIRLWEMVRTLTPGDWKVIWGSTGLTFVRILIAVVLSSLWTIPVGFMIGLSPKLTRILQPLVQITASFPMPMLFPLLMGLLLKLGIGIHWGSVLLFMMGVQWYILFNVLAGAMVVSRDLKDAMTLVGVRRWTRWMKLYIPSAFPALVTGWVTAAGGAWNASIVAEFVQYGGQAHVAPGIGSLITRATLNANFPLLAGCLIAMVVTVVGLNQTWWRWLAEVAETRFRFDK